MLVVKFAFMFWFFILALVKADLKDVCDPSQRALVLMFVMIIKVLATFAFSWVFVDLFPGAFK